ncbi:Protein broad-minded [Amphibalanus amphitrite]|uniref:Protein broad-minded n=1 Tax=Amphibalanus amphitrite TaxID=1232801 RepID=A0A6A4VT76_AMPAM|nr:Protein broad-minded [Amphibalanus amphitrite]KAF0293912.1 Protein broad-minded [Amphibalanus amphitrite]
MAAAQWTVDTVTQQTQQLLRQLGPLLASVGAGGGDSSAGELLLYLEELDLLPEQPGCGLLAALRAVVDAQLSAAISRAVRQLPALSGVTSRSACQQLGAQLLNRLAAQPDVQQLRNRLTQVTEAAAREMLENADELRDMVSDPTAAGGVRDLPAEALSRSVGSSLYGSLNPSLVFSPADLDGLGAALAPELEPQARAESLTLLQTALAAGSVGPEAWSQLRPAVQDALLDPSDEVAGGAQQVHARLLVSESHFFIKEAYLSLLEAVCTIYVERRRRTGAPHRGLNVGLTETKRALQILAMVNKYQRYVTRAWLRFPERHVEEMIDNTVDLLTLGVPRAGLSSLSELYQLPVALLCLADPAAAWCRHWMHAQFSRHKLVTVLRKSPQLLQLQLTVVQLRGRPDAPRAQPPPAAANTARVAEAVSEACYSHALHLLVCVAQYRSSAALFPIGARRDGGAGGTSLPELLQLLVTQACAAGGGPLPLAALVPALRLSAPLQEACAEPALLAELCEQLQRAFAGAAPRRCPPVVRLLLALTDGAGGQRLLAAGRRAGSTHRGSAGMLARAICQAAPRALRSAESGETAAAYSALLARLCRSHLGLQTLVMCELLQTLNERLHRLDPNLELSSRGLTALSEHVLPLCGQLARYPRALCVLSREQLLSPTLRWLGGSAAAGTAPLEGLLCLRRCATLLPQQAWLQQLLSAAVEQLQGVDEGWLQEEEESPALRTAHLLSCWAATHWGTWLLTRSGPRPLLPLELRSVFSDPGSPAWLCLLALMCCTHLDGRTLFITLTSGQTDGPAAADVPNIIDEASVLRQQAGALLRSVDLPTDTLIHQYLRPEVSLVHQYLRPESCKKSGLGAVTAAGQRADGRRALAAASRRPQELARFLSESRHSLHDAAWLAACRRALKSTLTGTGSAGVKESLLTELLDQLLEMDAGADAALSLPERCAQPAVSSLTEEDLSFDTDAAAADLVIQYGSRHRLVAGSVAVSESLQTLLRHARRLCGEISSEGGVHWFAAGVFLLYGGNLDRSRQFLTAYFRVPSSAYVWVGRGNQVARCRDLCTDELLLSGLLHHVGALVEQELPGLHTALQGGRLPLSSLCAPWLRQCYLGVLPWPEVRHYLALAVALGADYVLYFTVSVLRHLQTSLTRAAGRPLPLLAAKMTPIVGYQTREQLPYMETLCRRYRRSLLSDLNACLNQYKWGYEV